MIGEGDKYALVGLWTRSSVDLPPTELVPGVWASDKPFVQLETHWREWLGSIRAEQATRCNVWLMTKRHSAAPGILDNENNELENRIWRAYVGLLLADPFATGDAPLLISGACERGEVGIRRVRNLDKLIQLPIDPLHQLDVAALRRGLSLGESLSAFEAARPPHGSWRFNRALSLYTKTRTMTELVDQIHQYARCLEGLTVPPNRGGTGRNFAARVALFVGTSHESMFERLYKLRGEIEHLHENRYLETFNRAVRIELWKGSCILEHVARSCIARILDVPALWQHFRITSTVEAFWALPEPQRQAHWGTAVDPLQGLVGLDESKITDDLLGGP
jgi:hypothetical protein